MLAEGALVAERTKKVSHRAAETRRVSARSAWSSRAADQVA
jgi:hypothetical protein